MSKLSKMKDLGHPKEFVNVEIHWNNLERVGLCQSRITEKLKPLTNTGIMKYKGMSTLKDTVYDSSTDSELLTNEAGSKYGSKVGTLLYHVVETRPELAKMTRKFEIQAESPTEGGSNTTKCALRYFQRTNTFIIYHSPGKDTQVTAYVNVDWAAKPKGKQLSRSSELIRYGKTTIFSSSTPQKCNALSPAEA